MQTVGPNNLCLSGGGNEKQSFLLDEHFFSKIPQNSTFLYIPIALKQCKLYSGVEKWMRQVVAAHGRSDLSFDVAHNLHASNRFEKYTYIYIGGGNTWYLMSEFKKARIIEKLTKYNKFGGLIYGGSAGAIILGKYISAQNDKNLAKVKSPYGMNMLLDYSVACHYDVSQDSYFREWALEKKSSLLCLPEESGVFIENSSGRCVGDMPCVIFLSNGDRKEVLPTDCFDM